MTQPISFPSTTARLSLPLLFPGQAQKEFSLNHALAMLDALVTLSVDTALHSPPSDAVEGNCYRVLSPATGDWAGRDDTLAIHIGGAWEHVDPVPGMRIHDRAADQLYIFRSAWDAASEPALPQGGDVIDAEARQVLTDVIEALRAIGVFPNSGTK